MRYYESADVYRHHLWAVALALLPFAAAGQGTLSLTWVPPTQNTDGTPLTDLAGYRVYWGPQAGTYPNSLALNNPAAAAHVLMLEPGTWFSVVTAFNAAGVESIFSNVVSKTIAGSPPGPVRNLDVTPTTAQPVSVTISNRNASVNSFDLAIAGIGPVTIALASGLTFDWCRIGTVTLPTTPALGINADGMNARTVTFTAPVVGGRCDADPGDALAGTVTVQGVSKPLVNVAGVWSASFP